MWEHSGVIPIVFVPKAVPHLGEKQGRPRLRIKSANSTNQKVGSPILSAARRAVSHGGSTHRRKHIRKQSQHVNGVADSLPSGSGNVDVQLERQRLAFAHPLRDRDTRCDRRGVSRTTSNGDFCQAASNCCGLFRQPDRLQSDRSCLWTLRASHRGVHK